MQHHESKEEIAREVRAHEIYDIGRKAQLDQHVIVKGISENMSVGDFTELALDTLKSRQESRNTPNPEDNFSLRRFILSKSQGNSLSGAEAEVVSAEAAANQSRESVRGTLLPSSILNKKLSKRTLVAQGADSAGVALVDDELKDLIAPLDPMTPFLSHCSIVNVSKPYTAPVKDKASKAHWVGETQAAPEGNITFSSKPQKPHILSAWVIYSRELLQTASTDVEALIREDLRMSISLGVEKKILKSTGTNEPLGLENNSEIVKISRADANAVTYDEALTVEEKILGANIPVFSDSANTDPRMRNMMRRMGLIWIVSSKQRRLMRKTQFFDGASGSLWDQGDKGNDSVTIFGDGTTKNPKILGYPAFVSSFAQNNDSWCGRLSDLVISKFGGIDIVVDPFTLSTRGLVRVSIFQMIDWYVRYNASIIRLSA